MLLLLMFYAGNACPSRQYDNITTILNNQNPTQAGQATLFGPKKPNQQPPFPGQPPSPSQPPFPGQPPSPGKPPFPGQPSISGQSPIPSQPPFPVQPPNPGKPPFPGQLPFPTQPPISGKPPIPIPPNIIPKPTSTEKPCPNKQEQIEPKNVMLKNVKLLWTKERLKQLQLKICNDYEGVNDCCVSERFRINGAKYLDGAIGGRIMTFQFTEECKGFKITTMPTIPKITMSYKNHDDGIETLDLNIMQFEMIDDKTKIVCSLCRRDIKILNSGIDFKNELCYWTEKKIEM